MTQDEFNDLILDRFEALEKENKQLKQKLGKIDPELLAQLTIASDQAESLHRTMASEKRLLAEQSLNNRREFAAEVESAFTRLENSKNLAKSQMQLTYDAAAESNAALEQIRALHGEMSNMGGSLIERQENIVKNIDDRFANFDRMAGNEYIRELHKNDANKRSNAEISNEIQRQLRLMNPTAFAEPEEQQAEG